MATVSTLTPPKLEDYPDLNNKKLYQVLCPYIESNFLEISDLARRLNSSVFHAQLESAFTHNRRDYSCTLDPSSLTRATKAYNELKKESLEYVSISDRCTNLSDHIKRYITYFSLKQSTLEEVEKNMATKLIAMPSIDQEDASVVNLELTKVQERTVTASKIISELINYAASTDGIAAVSLTNTNLLEEQFVRLRSQIENKGQACGYGALIKRAIFKDTKILPDETLKTTATATLPSFKGTFAKMSEPPITETAEKEIQTDLEPPSKKQPKKPSCRLKRSKSKKSSKRASDPLSWMSDLMKR